MDDLIRVGFVSTVDTKTGMVQIYYPERMQTTAKLHLFFHEWRIQDPGYWRADAGLAFTG